MDRLNPATCIRGRVRTCRIQHHQRIWTPWKHNAVLYDWATIVGQLLTSGNPAYRIGGLFIEFQNVGAPGDAVTAPAFTRYDGISYYDALVNSADIDYLRVPLVAATLTSDDAIKFPGGNLLTFFAQTLASQTAGVFGKPFNDTAISKVFGGALVAIPDVADRTKDCVFSRFYLDSADQQVKLATSQVGIEWNLELA